ncbi:MAG TPA: dTDP-glucose 4,6-dehydratase [Peptococcaceae bacterium]|nr:dTDP-glucose 4,6-dehydratase [Peptococcaceae bacterium]
MKAIMVTGGAGFIGSNFIRYFMESHPDYLIINYDNLTYAGNLNNVQDLAGSSKYVFIKGDICDTEQVEKVLKDYDPEYVLNFAAESHVDRSINDPLLFGKTNVLGTLNLLYCLQKHWQGDGYTSKRFLQVSTDEVYGSIANLEDYFDEESNLLPNSPYSASKAGADLLGRAFYRTYNFPIIITRCCNNYGPYQYKEKFIPNSIIKALKDEPIPIYGDGTNRREWIHVTDHCAAIDQVLFGGKPGEIYNIGSGEEVSNLEMAEMILKYLGKPTDAIVKVADRPGHDWRYALNSDKIKSFFQWKCNYSLTEGIKETIKWYQENRDWWDEK